MAKPGDPTTITDPALIELPIGVGGIYYSRVYVGVITPLLVISSVLVGVRVFTRLRSSMGLRIEDWLLVLVAVSPLAVNYSCSRPPITDTDLRCSPPSTGFRLSLRPIGHWQDRLS